MAVVLDTSVAIYLRDQDPYFLDRYAALDDKIFLSIVTLVELEAGVERNEVGRVKRRASLEAMIDAIDILRFEEPDARVYGKIVAALGYSRPRVLDYMIAAQAIVQAATLVTTNIRDFRRVPDLRVIDWSQ